MQALLRAQRSSDEGVREALETHIRKWQWFRYLSADHAFSLPRLYPSIHLG